MSLFERIANQRVWPLFVKELRQIGRNRRLVISLIIPPTIQIIIFGFALNPEVTNLRLGVVDSSRSAFSRELVSAFVESRAFDITGYYASSDDLGKALSAGKLDAGLVIPYDFVKQRERHVTASVQLLLDAVNSNTAQIAGGYAARIVAAVNQRVAVPPSVGSAQPTPTPQSDTANSGENTASAPAPPVVDLSVSGPSNRGSVVSRVALLYNPGLENAWFIVTGTLGTLLVLNGSLVASGSLVKEKETGTIEQLLMTPAEASEVITAKIAPLFILLCGDIGLALIVSYVAFRVPVRGSLLLLYTSGALCVLAGIGIGTFIATFTRSQQQAQLLGFFVNPPLALLSGATTPIEAMPRWLQPLTLVNPIRHFADIARGVMLKGAGIEVLYPHLLALIGVAFLLVGISAWNFRKQLG
jgi:ABC-2 type transport system permease protein